VSLNAAGATGWMALALRYADIVAASRAAAGLVVSRALAGAFTLMPLIAMAAGRHG